MHIRIYVLHYTTVHYSTVQSYIWIVSVSLVHTFTVLKYTTVHYIAVQSDAWNVSVVLVPVYNQKLKNVKSS